MDNKHGGIEDGKLGQDICGCMPGDAYLLLEQV